MGGRKDRSQTHRNAMWTWERMAVERTRGGAGGAERSGGGAMGLVCTQGMCGHHPHALASRQAIVCKMWDGR